MLKTTKLTAVLAIAGLVLALAPAAQAGPLPAWTDSIVGSYRIIFTTSGTYDAVPTAIATYNTRVQDAADATSGNAIDLSSITDWKMIGSTSAVDARDNTGTSILTADASNVPIYNVNGVMVAAGNAELWGTSIGAYDPSGPPWYILPADALLAPILSITGGTNGSRIWTGTQGDGTAWSANYLGATLVGQGRGDGRYDGKWIRDDDTTGNPNPQASSYNHHALSGVIPEPATMSLLAIGGIALLRRKRRA